MIISFAYVVTLIALTPLAHAEDDPWRGRALVPLPEIKNIDVDKSNLGESLFHDPRLSADDTISCATCHDLSNGGADGRNLPIGIDGTQGAINTPTVFNSAYNFSQFWDGRADSLEEQAAGPVHNPAEMGSNWADVVAKLNRDKGIKAAFKKSYPDGITGDNIVDAIAVFERTLVTYNAPFDRYLKGDKKAITPTAEHGYELFQSYGCTSCHQGVNIGGNMYQTMGAMGDYFGDRGDESGSDQGRYQVTGRERDRHVFKVPSLRMVAHTAPYFHDGSAATLKDAVQAMAKYQLGRDMPDKDVSHIVEFLGTLAGEYKRFAP